MRKQTLANAERYITPELKEYEEKITGAEEKILKIELELFEALLNEFMITWRRYKPMAICSPSWIAFAVLPTMRSNTSIKNRSCIPG